MQASRNQNTGEIALILTPDEAVLLFSAVYASGPSGTDTKRKRFTSMMLEAESGLSIKNMFSSAWNVSRRWRLHSFPEVEVPHEV